MRGRIKSVDAEVDQIDASACEAVGEHSNRRVTRNDMDLTHPGITFQGRNRRDEWLPKSRIPAGQLYMIQTKAGEGLHNPDQVGGLDFSARMRGNGLTGRAAVKTRPLAPCVHGDTNLGQPSRRLV